jgi:hypothetical protein
MFIFGPDWTDQDVKFEASDDRDRGGSSKVIPNFLGQSKSQSHLEIHSNEYALFYGTLDTKTLGGAGFASRRTADTSKVWDCSGTDGILLQIPEADGLLPNDVFG